MKRELHKIVGVRGLGCVILELVIQQNNDHSTLYTTPLVVNYGQSNPSKVHPSMIHTTQDHTLLKFSNILSLYMLKI